MAMELGKKMMEKWGWQKGQGLGKDSRGIKSCLVLRKTEGTVSQGRIEPAAVVVPAGPTVKKAEDEVKDEPVGTGSVAAGFAPTVSAKEAPKEEVPKEEAPKEEAPKEEGAADQDMAAFLNCVHDLEADTQQPSDVTMAAPVLVDTSTEEPPRKKRRSKWDEDVTDAPPEAQGVDAAVAPPAVPDMSHDPVASAMLETIRAALGSGADSLMAAMMGTPPGAMGNMQANMAHGFPAASLPRVEKAEDAADAAEEFVSSAWQEFNSGLKMPKTGVRQRKWFPRQWVHDDWRWSKGTEALLAFEEVELPPNLQELARRVLGDHSRYPARITDDTDVIVEITAWGTILLRPRGSGANLLLAKQMVYRVLHPKGDSLRDEVLIQHDEEAEAKIRDLTTISGAEAVVDSKQLTAATEMASASAQGGKMKRVGLGLNVNEAAQAKEGSKEITLATPMDVRLVQEHMSHIRASVGVTPMLNGGTLTFYGKEHSIAKAEQLVATLLQTGQWVAFTESFVLSEETKEKRREQEGPSEQILIKVPEGIATHMIVRHLKAMERAAEADQLRITSKAIQGKRSLMVDGSKRAHERVKLMVKEIMAQGSSPMLSKVLGVGRSDGASATADMFVSTSFGSSESSSKPKPGATSKAAGAPPPSEGWGSIIAPGVIAAPFVPAPGAEEPKKEMPFQPQNAGRMVVMQHFESLVAAQQSAAQDAAAQEAAALPKFPPEAPPRGVAHGAAVPKFPPEPPPMPAPVAEVTTPFQAIMMGGMSEADRLVAAELFGGHMPGAMQPSTAPGMASIPGMSMQMPVDELAHLQALAGAAEQELLTAALHEAAVQGVTE